MNIALLIIACICYIFGGIGYIVTIKHFNDKPLKNGKIVLSILFIFWLFWLILLGFGITATEIEFWINKKLRKLNDL